MTLRPPCPALVCLKVAISEEESDGERNRLRPPRQCRDRSGQVYLLVQREGEELTSECGTNGGRSPAMRVLLASLFPSARGGHEEADAGLIRRTARSRSLYLGPSQEEGKRLQLERKARRNGGPWGGAW